MHGSYTAFALQLSDRRDLDGLHGRIAMGSVIPQALAVVIAMMARSVLRGTTGGDGEDPEVLEAVPLAATLPSQENPA